MALASMMLTGVSTVIKKSQGKELKPIAILFIEAIVTGLSFFIIVAIQGELRAAFTVVWWVFLPLFTAAFLWIILGEITYLTSLEKIGVSKAYPISMTYPLLTYILSMIFLGEEFIWLKLIGIVLVIIGVIFISFSKKEEKNLKKTNKIEKSTEGVDHTKENILVNDNNDNPIKLEEDDNPGNINSSSKNRDLKSDEKIIPTSFTFSDLLGKELLIGVTLALLTAIFWASGTTLIKYSLDRTELGITVLNCSRMLALVPISSVIFLTLNKGERKSSFTWKNIGLIILVAILSLVLGNITYLWAVNYAGASSSAAINAAGPLIATPLSILFLKEKVNWQVIAGTLLTVGGIILIILMG
jgi:drug/metabolite transporter (DMT)-like permease